MMLAIMQTKAQVRNTMQFKSVQRYFQSDGLQLLMKSNGSHNSVSILIPFKHEIHVALSIGYGSIICDNLFIELGLLNLFKHWVFFQLFYFQCIRLLLNLKSFSFCHSFEIQGVFLVISGPQWGWCCFYRYILFGESRLSNDVLV